MEGKHSAWVHSHWHSSAKSFSRIGFYNDCCKSNGNDESCQPKSRVCKETFQAATFLYKLSINDEDGDLKTRYEHFGEKILNSAGRFKPLVICTCSRLVTMVKLGIAELLVCLLVTHVTMTTIVILCSTKNKAGDKNKRFHKA